MTKMIAAVTDWTVVDGWDRPVRIYMFTDGTFATCEFHKYHTVGMNIDVTERKGKKFNNVLVVK